MPPNSREQIFSSLRANIPPERVEHPQIPAFRRAATNLKSTFEKHLQDAGGAAHDIENPAAAQAKVASLHPTAQGDLLRGSRDSWDAARRFDSRSTRTRGCRCGRCSRPIRRCRKWGRLAYARRPDREQSGIPVPTSRRFARSRTNRRGYARRLCARSSGSNSIRLLHDGVFGDR